jgi:hypothetical protein
MKRLFIVVLLVALVLPCSLVARKKSKPVDIITVNHVFIGWVGVNTDDFKKRGYKTKQDWTDVIDNANRTFQKQVAGLKVMAGKTTTGAKDANDASPGENDLYVKFSDVNFDHKYRLHLSAHFIDPKTNNELGDMALETYKSHFCTLSTCLDKDLAEVGNGLEHELSRGAGK